jgi:hypothetical protein
MFDIHEAVCGTHGPHDTIPTPPIAYLENSPGSFQSGQINYNPCHWVTQYLRNRFPCIPERTKIHCGLVKRQKNMGYINYYIYNLRKVQKFS